MPPLVVAGLRREVRRLSSGLSPARVAAVECLTVEIRLSPELR
ncbi:hypothetical protein RSPPQCQH_CDS0052 [Mycolicibacterium phage phi1_186001]